MILLSRVLNSPVLILSGPDFTGFDFLTLPSDLNLHRSFSGTASTRSCMLGAAPLGKQKRKREVEWKT